MKKRCLLLFLLISLAVSAALAEDGNLQIGGEIYSGGTYYQPEALNNHIDAVWDSWVNAYGFWAEPDNGMDICVGGSGGLKLRMRFLNLIDLELWGEFFRSGGKQITLDYYYYDGYGSTTIHKDYKYLPSYSSYGVHLVFSPAVNRDKDFRLRFGGGIGNYTGKLEIETDDGDYIYEGSEPGASLLAGVEISSEPFFFDFGILAKFVTIDTEPEGTTFPEIGAGIEMDYSSVDLGLGAGVMFEL